ncbi:MAG TPA: tetratricopeptide repeat protein [Acidisarcina sp.]
MFELDFHEQIEALMDIEAYDEVVRRLEEDGALDPDDFISNWNLGWSRFKLQQFQQSLPPLERALALEPAQFAAHFSLGAALEALGRLEEAETSLRTALALRDSGMARQALAVVLMEKGEFAAAEQVHLDGIEVNPDSANRWEGYADFLYDTGRLKEAQAAREKASRFDSRSDSSEDDED